MEAVLYLTGAVTPLSGVIQLCCASTLLCFMYGSVKWCSTAAELMQGRQAFNSC